MFRVIIVVVLLFINSGSSALNLVSGMLGNLFSGGNKEKVPEFNLESIGFSSTLKSNDGMPTRLHIVIVYDSNLAIDLKSRTAKQYFKMVDQLKNDYASKIKIFEWNIPAREYVSPVVKIKYEASHLKPYIVLIFALIGGKRGAAVNRYSVSESTKHINIRLEKTNFKVNEVKYSVIK